MQNTFFSSNISRKCNNSLSYSSYCSNDRFCRYNVGYVSQFPLYSPSSSCLVSSCCCCCSCCGNANSNLSMYKVPVTPVYLCGLRQSTLIQYIPSKKVIFSGLDRGVCRLSGSKRSNFEKGGIFRQKGRGKARYSGSEEFGIDNEAEVMLSLLTEEVSAECLEVRRSNGRRGRKVVVEETGDGDDECATCGSCGSMKKVGSGSLRNSLKIEYESGVKKSRDEDGDRRQERREEENEALLRRRHQVVRGRVRREERDELLREIRKKEKEDTLIKNQRLSVMKERREDLSRREEHRQRLRKDGSSCSSYYSLGSTGEFESDSEIQETKEGLEEILSSKYKRDSGRFEEIELDKKDEKGKRVERNELNWRKESEKKLTDMSNEETSFLKDSYKKYEGREEKATSMVKSNQVRREHRHTSDEVVQKTETINNYKQFKENSERYGANLTSSSDSLAQHSQGEGIFTTGSSSLTERRKEYYDKARHTEMEDEYKKISKHTQSSNSQKVDISKTSSSQKDREEDSSIVSSSVRDAKEKYYHHGGVSTQIDSRITSQQLTEEIDIQRATISQRQSEDNIKKQEASSSSMYGSNHESIKNIQTNEGAGKLDSKMIMEKRNDPSLGNDGGSRNDADQLAVVTPQVRGALHAGSTSGLVIKEVGHGSSHETSGGSYISQEDALASAGLFHRSSAYHVGEFMEKARHEMSSSETEKEKQAHEMKMDLDPKGQESKSRHSSPSSRSKGPSVEMWDVDEPSNQEQPGAEVLDSKSANSVITKKAGRSLWNVMSDIVRFNWGLRSTNQSQVSKSGGKNSPNQSTTSEAWFSGNDENIQETDKNRKRSVSDVTAQGSASGNNFSSSGEQTSHQQIEGMVSGSSMTVDSSGGGKVVQTDLPVATSVSEISEPKGKDGEQQSRKLSRTTQVVRDRFEEWEEAYRVEAEQRKMDEMFMREALLEAKKAADNWEVPVGAVLVHDGKIIARGHNLVEELRDSTAHAEMICIRNASSVLRSWRLSETILYVTLEPCAMCAGAILQARVDVVVWGAPNKLLGADGSWIRLFPSREGENSTNTSDKAAGPVHPFHPNIQIRRNVLASECADTMQQFFQRRRRKKDKQPEAPTASPTTSSSSRRLVIHPSKLLTKMQDAFHMMFCL